jgi:hypothetical protein
MIGASMSTPDLLDLRTFVGTVTGSRLTGRAARLEAVDPADAFHVGVADDPAVVGGTRDPSKRRW